MMIHRVRRIRVLLSTNEKFPPPEDKQIISLIITSSLHIY